MGIGRVAAIDADSGDIRLGAARGADDLARGAMTLPMAIGAILFVLLGGLLLVLGSGPYPNLHTILDTCVALLSSALTAALWDMGARARQAFPKWLAIGFAVTSVLELIHVLVIVEWAGPFSPIAAAAYLRPATWPPDAYALPIAIGFALWRLRRGSNDLLSYAGAVIALAIGLFLAFQWLPAFLPPGPLGITRPTLALSPVLWAIVGFACWRRRQSSRLLEPLAGMSVMLFMANAVQLVSRGPGGPEAMVAHLGKGIGYAILLLSIMRMASLDMVERMRAETLLAEINRDLEKLVRDRSANLEEANRALRVETERLRAIVDTAADGIVLIDVAGTVLMFNAAAERLFGYRADEVVGNNVKMLMPPSYAAEHDAYLDHHRRTGERKIIGFGREVAGRRKDGTTFPMHLAVGEARQHGELIYAGIVHDLTQRNLAEASLREMQMLLTGIVESSDDAIISKTLDGIVTSWNHAATRIFGYSSDEMIGQHISRIAVPGREDDVAMILDKLRAGQRIEHYETQRRRKDGTVIDVSLTVSPLYDAQGRIFGASKILRDITGRKTAEQDLRRSQEHLARVQSVARIGSTEVDLVSGEAVWSDEIYGLLGVDPDAIEPGVDSFASAIHPEDGDLVRDVSLRGRRGEEVEPIEFRTVLPDGTIRWFYRKADFVRDPDGKPTRLIATMYDITERKAAEAALVRSSEHLARVQSIARIGSIEVDLATQQAIWSDEMYGLLGLDPKRRDPGVGAFAAALHPDDRALAMDLSARGRRGEEAAPCEYRVVLPDGRLRWLYQLSTILRDPAGKPVRHVATMYDVTERKEAEARRLQLEEQLLQSQKMEAVGRLTGGVAHDFNNLLTVVLGNLELVRDEVDRDPEIAKRIDAAAAAGRRGADLTHRLLAFSRRQPLEPVVVEINERIAELVPLLSRTIGEAIDIRQRLAVRPWPVVIDPSQFDNAIMNLAVNARDAMSGGGELVIATENFVVDEHYADQRAELATGNYVRVSVSDTGSGMPPEVVEKAFEPFFTTKGVGKGTGLGLSMVYGFVKQSGGHVSIYSEVGVGTTITMLLPATPENRLRIDPRVAQAATLRGTELVLVVEDDLAVRTVAVSFLQALGYKTLEAGTVADGYETFAAHPDIGLILTDVILPGGEDGAALARRARALRPDVKLLFMSGYTEDVVMHGGRLDPGVVLLHKPFTRSQLAEKVRAVIDGPAAPDV